MIFSKNFKLSEFLNTDRQDLQDEPTYQVVTNLNRIVQKVLQPLRDYYQKPLIITSGYRSQGLNKQVDGSDSSDHMTGKGVDFYVPRIQEIELARKIIELKLPYDQLILSGRGYVHLGLRAVFNRNQILIKQGDKYVKASINDFL